MVVAIWACMAPRWAHCRSKSDMPKVVEGGDESNFPSMTESPLDRTDLPGSTVDQTLTVGPVSVPPQVTVGKNPILQPAAAARAKALQDVVVVRQPIRRVLPVQGPLLPDLATRVAKVRVNVPVNGSSRPVVTVPRGPLIPLPDKETIAKRLRDILPANGTGSKPAQAGALDATLLQPGAEALVLVRDDALNGSFLPELVRSYSRAALTSAVKSLVKRMRVPVGYIPQPSTNRSKDLDVIAAKDIAGLALHRPSQELEDLTEIVLSAVVPAGDDAAGEYDMELRELVKSALEDEELMRKILMGEPWEVAAGQRKRCANCAEIQSHLCSLCWPSELCSPFASLVDIPCQR